jgi:choline dehydrogenase-like flavoprotein
VLHQVRAKREMIVSAGAYGSPQLLLLSGIGPADELASHGIGVREELPAGRGLQDHLVVSGVWLTGESALLT